MAQARLYEAPDPNMVFVMAGAATDEVFSFTAWDGAVYFWNMTAMRRHLRLSPDIEGVVRGPVQVHRQMVEQIGRNGIEGPKILRLLSRPDIYNEPVIFLDMADDTHVLADGNHRFFIKAVLCEKPTVEAYIVQKHIWQKFLLNLPRELAPKCPQNQQFANA